MSSDSIPLLIVFILFVLCGAYFAGAESAFTAMNKIKIKSKADEGDRRAKNTMYIANNFERALSTLLIGNNVARTAAASVATVIAAHEFSDIPNSSVWTTVVTTLIFFFFSEMIPKSFANDRSDTTALLFSSSLRFLMKLLGPLATFFTWISHFFSRLFSGEAAPSITEDELIDIIDTAEEEGVVDEEKSEMLRSAIDFSSTTAADVMTMREDIQAIALEQPMEEVLAFIRQSRHSRIPVYEGELDHVVGILQIRKFLKAYCHDHNADIRALLTDPYFAAPDALIDDLLDHMSHSKNYLAIVRDADGRTVGLVTIEDFLEELVGEIWDEDDVVDQNFVKLGGNRFSVSAQLALSEVFSRIGLPTENEDSRTISTWVLERFAHLPEEDESFTEPYAGRWLTVTVDELADNRIVRIIIKLDEEDPSLACVDGEEGENPA